MLRAARSATADHVRILLQQLLFFHRVKIAAMRLQHQLEETMDDLDDIGFDGQVLNSILRAAHLELCSFIARCDQAMMTTEQRILHTGTLKYPNSTVQVVLIDLHAQRVQSSHRGTATALRMP